MKLTTQKITPFLWFDDKAEQAAKFYCSIFKNNTMMQMTKIEIKDLKRAYDQK